jgi:peptide deformylase
MSGKSLVESWKNKNLVMIGDPILRQSCEPIEDINDCQDLCDRMVALLRELNGAGLAAPQIGEAKRVIVVELRKNDFFPNRKESPLYVMINPEVEEVKGEIDVNWESCFSIPGLIGRVPRQLEIKVKYLDPSGHVHHESFDEHIARIIQHEIDHLNGILFLDRMTDLKGLSTIENYKKLLVHHVAMGGT